MLNVHNIHTEIYSYCDDFPTLVNFLVNKNFILLRPYGSFDDKDFCIEIYEKNSTYKL